MAYASQLQEAADRLEPLCQGSHDNLCGIYSILNGIRLASWPVVLFDKHKSRRLFQHAIGVLQREELLASVHRYGMADQVWLQLIEELLTKAEDMTGIQLQRKPAFRHVDATNFDRGLASIDRHTRMGSPVLVTLLGDYNHYTVIVELSGDKIKLFDSYGYKWVWVSSCSFELATTTARHRILCRGTVVIH